MKITKLQAEDLSHAIYVALDTDIEERENYETDCFLYRLLEKVESRILNNLTEKEIDWLKNEASNLESIFSHNFKSDGDGKKDVLSAKSLLKKIDMQL